jgi:hypothetical protein
MKTAKIFFLKLQIHTPKLHSVVESAQIENKNMTIKVEYINFPSNLIRFKENNIPYKQGHFTESEKYMQICPYETNKDGTKIEYFEYDPNIKKSFIYSSLDKIYSML